MGTQTTDQMVTQVRFKMDNRSATDITAAQILRWLNGAYDHVCRPSIFRHRELQSTQNITLAASDRDYALASNFDFIHSVFNVDEGYGLDPGDIREFDRSRITTSRPVKYDTWGTDLIINCNPSSTYQGDILRVRYYVTRTLLTAGTGTTTIHERWDEIIVEGATWRGWKDLSNIDRADQCRDEFARMINEITDIARIEAEDWGSSSEPQIQPVMRVS